MWKALNAPIKMISFLPRVTHDGVFVWFGICYRRTLCNPCRRDQRMTQYLSKDFTEARYQELMDQVEW